MSIVLFILAAVILFGIVFGIKKYVDSKEDKEKQKKANITQPVCVDCNKPVVTETCPECNSIPVQTTLSVVLKGINELPTPDDGVIYTTTKAVKVNSSLPIKSVVWSIGTELITGQNGEVLIITFDIGQRLMHGGATVKAVVTAENGMVAETFVNML